MQLNLFAEYSHIFNFLEKIAPKGLPLYLVGGAIRDSLLQQPTHDLDFILGGDIRPTARKIADQFKGSYFLLDDERNTARVLLPGSNSERLILDFASMQGGDIQEDLRQRDFTINAIAFDLRAKSAFDPLKGALDLKYRKLVPCSAEACQKDPVRVLRGVRLALNYDLKITPAARMAIQDAAGLLKKVSTERIRDEIFRIFELERTSTALRILDALGAVEVIFPELAGLKTQEPSAERRINSWELSLAILSRLEVLFNLIVGPRDEHHGENMFAGMAVLQLGPYRFHLQGHMARRLNPHRTQASLLKLAGLYLITCSSSRDKDALELRARQLALGNIEIQHLASVLQAESILENTSRLESFTNPKTIYRYFDQFGESGLDGCLLFLAHYWAEGGVNLDPKDWGKQLESISTVFEAWWHKHDLIVDPPILLDGNDLIDNFKLEAGPLIGQLLQEIRELQAGGEITNRVEALEYARERLSKTN